LRQADSQVLQEALRNLGRAYVNFFVKRAEYPKFKSKHSKQSIRYPQRFKVNGKRVYLPKVGWVKAAFHRPLEGAMKNCTVSKTKSGKYFVSIQCEVEIEDPTPRPTQVGIDLGLTTFATLSTGEKIDKPKYLHRSERRLKIRQRRLSRKAKGSKHRNHARQPLAVLHEKVANQRKDFQHKLSRDLVDRFGSISFESLNVNGMLKNHKLAKAISDAAWSQFVGFCEYKAGWSNIQLLRVDRFFPSSKLCSDCGEKHHSLTLSVRQWVCLNCGAVHDRDENAAVNILNQAFGLEAEFVNNHTGKALRPKPTVGATESYATGATTAAVGRSARLKPNSFSVG
jgi:putative transposase